MECNYKIYQGEDINSRSVDEVYDKFRNQTKVIKALQEVSSKLDPDEDYDILLDRAYEIGFRPEWDGTIKFNTEIFIAGQPVCGIIDVDEAIDEDEAFALGYIDLKAISIGKEFDSTRPDDEDSEVELQEYSPKRSRFNYGWGHATGSGFFRAWAGPGQYRVSTNRRLRRHGVRGRRRGGANAGRTRYTKPGTNKKAWSNWRHGTGSAAIEWYTFGKTVTGHIAEIGGGW